MENNLEKKEVKTGNGAKAPFPWFGGKSKAASLIWSRLGADVGNYVEPFLGSAAVFLSRPKQFSGWATLNDFDGHVVNFWRACRLFPNETAEAACNPVFEADLHARHIALVTRRGALTERLCADPDYCEPLLAGWWAWGLCSSVNANWMRGGPWQAFLDTEGFLLLTKGEGEGDGVTRSIPALCSGRGVVAFKKGPCADKIRWIQDWFRALADNIHTARIACGDWQRICTPSVMTIHGTCGVLLDPPYSQTDAVYAIDSSTVAHDVRAWCIANGTNPLLRIALCGHAGEHEALEALGWQVETWRKGGGYQGADDRERIWFSPACLRPDDRQGTLF